MHFHDVAADDCKKRWKTLRDNFAKAVRQEKSKRSGSAAEAKQKRIAVNRLLEFLEPYVSTRRSVTSNNTPCGVTTLCFVLLVAVVQNEEGR